MIDQLLTPINNKVFAERVVKTCCGILPQDLSISEFVV
jgi:hypothetical protein